MVKQLSINASDDFYNVITKLSIVRDLVQAFNTPKFCLSKQTPDGLGNLLSECITTLNEIGGFNETFNG